MQGFLGYLFCDSYRIIYSCTYKSCEAEHSNTSFLRRKSPGTAAADMDARRCQDALVLVLQHFSALLDERVAPAGEEQKEHRGWAVAAMGRFHQLCRRYVFVFSYEYYTISRINIVSFLLF